MKVLDYPEKQELVLNYIRHAGKFSGCGAVVQASDQMVRDYMKTDAKFAARVAMAKQQFENGEMDDLQTRWNRNAEINNRVTSERIFEYLLEGERSTEVNTKEVPVRDADGNIQKDEQGNDIMEVECRFIKNFIRPTPKWVLDLALELMRQDYGKVEIEKIAPTIVLQFVQYLKSEGETLSSEGMQEVIGLASKFDSHLKAQVLALKGKTVK